MSNDELNYELDLVSIRFTQLKTHQEVLSEMILGVLKETLTAEQYKNVYTNYVNTLESETNKALDELNELVSVSSLLKMKIEFHSAMSHLKRDQDYISLASNKPQS